MSRQGGTAPSQRQLRVGEQVRHVLAEWLMRGELHDPRLASTSITIGEVQVSRDLKNATVFAAELGSATAAATIEALQQAAPRLAGRIAREMNLKYAPRLRFVADDSFERADAMERLLAEARARLRPEEDEHGAA